MNGIEEVESKPRFALTVEGKPIGTFEQDSAGQGFFVLVNVENSRESMTVRDSSETRRHLPGPVDPRFKLSEKVIIVDVSITLKKRLGWVAAGDESKEDSDLDASEPGSNLNETA